LSRAGAGILYDRAVRAVVATSVLGLAACGRFSFDADRDAVPGAIDAPGAHDGGTDGTPPADATVDCNVTEGLQGYWPMDFDDVAGNLVEDVSGFGHNGMYTDGAEGMPVLIGGRIGEALDFQGTTVAYVDLPSIPLAQVAGEANTVVLWFFQPASNPNEVIVYLPPGPGPAPPRYDLWITNDPGPVALCINSGQGDCWGTTDGVFVGRWVHVAVVFVNGPTTSGRLYVDGAPVAMTCVMAPCDQSRSAMMPVHLGGSDSAYDWHGKLDEVRFYNRALDDKEVQRLFSCQ
jgi:hypothetical protein